MRIRILMLNVVIFLSMAHVFGQKSSLKVDRTAKYNESLHIKQAEVSLEEWISFIINNNFDQDLFPSDAGLPKNLIRVFNELKKTSTRGNFSIQSSGREKIKHGSLRIYENEYLKSLFDEESTNLSLNIPVTGISYEQALKFCKWKEKLINSESEMNVEISLPTIEIYKKVITNKDSLNDKLCAMYNWAFCSCSKELTRNKQAVFQGKHLVRVDAYWPTELGIYNLQGNAGEMTSTKGVAMGGSFRHSARETYSDRQQTYNQAEPWLGFRYVIKTK